MRSTGSSVRSLHTLLFALALALSALLALPLAGQAAAPCNPLSAGTCVVPFPSNYWSVADGSSSTGIRLQVPDGVVRPEVISKLPTADGVSPSALLNGSTGFSAATGAVFEFGVAPNAATLPRDGGSAVIAFDLDSGLRVPIDAFVNNYASSPLVQFQSHIIQVFPRSRYAYKHRIVIAVTKALSAPGDATPDFDQMAAAQTPGSPEDTYVDGVATALGAAGIPTASVRSATLFTVRDRDEVVGPEQMLFDRTLSSDHPVRNLFMTPDLLNPWIAGVVTGELRTTNYRRKNGTTNVDYSGATSKQQWIPFRLTLPRSAGKSKAALAIYGHGLTALKETDLLVSSTNAQLGLATISIDYPNHGARILIDGGYAITNVTPSKIPHQLGMLNQATFDTAALYKAIKSSLAGVDYLRKPSLLNPLGFGGDGKPDLDPAHISAQGTSLGGVLGSNFGALAPSLDGAVYHVTGSGITHILSDSILWPGLFSNLIPYGATGAESITLLTAIQQDMDRADAINTFDFFRHPRPGQTKKPLMLIVGRSDSLIPAYATTATANIVDLPVVGTQLFAVPGARTTADYDADGYGIRQYEPWTGPVNLGPYLSGSTGHVAFARPEAIADQQAFLKRFITP